MANPNIEWEFVEKLVGQRVQIYLVNSVAMKGTLLRHDEDCIVLSGKQSGEETLIYKDHATALMRAPDAS
jgi:sRNA-binding regulator protein Hfq